MNKLSTAMKNRKDDLERTLVTHHLKSHKHMLRKDMLRQIFHFQASPTPSMDTIWPITSTNKQGSGQSLQTSDELPTETLPYIANYTVSSPNHVVPVKKRLSPFLKGTSSKSTNSKLWRGIQELVFSSISSSTVNPSM